MWLLTGSVPLFTAFGIRVRAQASLLLLIALELIFSSSRGGLGPKNAVVGSTILFASVLLHEFGHCFGARWVGGEASDILMWPLGGLASIDPPKRPWPSFISTAAGPAVNLVICLITGTAICVIERSASAIPWLPVFKPLRDYVPGGWTSYYLWWVFIVNYGLFMFNMCLVFYPFDAGRMIQEVLWWKIGYYKSMRVATAIGMVGAVIAAMIGLALFWFMLILIAAFGFYQCYQQRQLLQEMGPDEFGDGIDYSAAYEIDPTPKRKLSRWSIRRAAKRAQKVAAEDTREREQIDAILAKVSAHGMHSLTWLEKRALKKATQHQRQRDVETPRRRG
jgi:Zn-dependent protease